MENVACTATEEKHASTAGFEEAKAMKKATCCSENEKLSLKEPSGWFAAGNGFRKASTLLSDGAFKLFVYLCMEANRQTGRLQATHQELATALGKSKRSIGTHVRELQVQGFCKVVAANNQYGRTVFEILDAYWPYCRREPSSQSSEEQTYIESIREYFLSFGCVSGRFSTADAQMARLLYQRAIPLGVIQNAMLLGACRKYESWFHHHTREPIQSLRYFEPVIAELQAQPLPAGYAGYLRRKLQQYALEAEALPTSPPTRATPQQSSDAAFFTDSRLLAQKFHQQSDKTEETR